MLKLLLIKLIKKVKAEVNILLILAPPSTTVLSDSRLKRKCALDHVIDTILLDTSIFEET